VPVPFNTSHARNLAAWDGSLDFPELGRLIADLDRFLGPRASAPPAPPVPERAVTPAPTTRTPKVSQSELVRSEPEVESPRPLAKSRRARARKAQISEVPEPEMVRIEPGTFLMGSAKGSFFVGLFGGGGYGDECPQHEVRIARPFAMGRYPVTFEEYDAFVKAAKRELPGDEGWGRGKRPVIDVSWEDAVAYAQWMSGQTGKRYRLPTEAEWEYVARAGTKTRWSFGDEGGALGRYAWFSGNSESKTHPVGEKEANPWGLHDAYGNIWEWVADCWHENYDGAPTDGSAWQKEGGGDCGRRVVRGGSWGTIPVDVRSAARSRGDAVGRNSNLGFRLAQDL